VTLADQIQPDETSGAAALKPFDGRVLIVAGLAFGVMMAFSGLYGYDRDELYFLDAARHLQGGYVDQPILAPLLARVSLSLFGVSLPGLRIWPSLALAATVIVGALLAREFGGGRRAQLLAAIGTATMPVVIGADHLEGPTSIDILAWAMLALVVARIGRTGNPRGWILGGLVLGLGLANKHSVGFFAIAIFLGAILSGDRRLVLNRWLLVGLLIAGVFTVPDLWWQALHGWPTIAMTKSLNAENGGVSNIANWFIGQVIMVSLAIVWV
jgi:4-amino-4-deoxy-L-arabinose transferase-like glycosyltransferase